MSLPRIVVSWCVGVVCLAGLGPTASAEDASAPSAPFGLLGYSNLDGTLTLVWQPPLEDGGAAIQEYRVYHAEYPGDFALIGVATSTSYVAAASTDLVSIHAYRVTAVNAHGESAASGPCIDVMIEIPPSIVIDPSCLPVCRIACLWWPPICVPC